MNYVEFKEVFVTMKSKIMRAIKKLGGVATSSEIMTELNVRNPNSVRPRITELIKEGMIIKKGEVTVINEYGVKVHETVYEVV
jgi:predicted transcriptional regulator